MPCRPEMMRWRQRPGPKLSVILIDWRARESFHSLHYLAYQTLPRDQYELIWLEFYDHRPHLLTEIANGPLAPDKWLVAGYSDSTLYHKHRLYNLGLLLAQGEHCIICDSDAIFAPDFLEQTLRALQPGDRVVHVDQVRSIRRDLYPFRYPSIADVLAGEVCNWTGSKTTGLLPDADVIHARNYGACMAAPRQRLLDIGGADEHLGYLGYVCGPYEMTFRLNNVGLDEHWLDDVFLYHTWHPNASGFNYEYHGPHDNAFMSLVALESRALGRVLPLVENPWIARARQGQTLAPDQLLQALRAEPQPDWRPDQPLLQEPRLWWIEHGWQGFNVFFDGRQFIGIPAAQGLYDPAQAWRYHPLITGKTAHDVRHIIEHYNNLPRDLWGRLWAQPLRQLPGRIVRTVQRRLRRMVTPRSGKAGSKT